LRRFRSMLLLLTLFAAGCGRGAAETQASLDLATMNLQYHWFQSTYDRPPRSAEELLAFENPYSALPANREDQDRCRVALLSGRYVVIWGVSFSGMEPQTHPAIYMYEKRAATKGGVVCYPFQPIKVMTAAEFARATKAQPSQETSLRGSGIAPGRGRSPKSVSQNLTSGHDRANDRRAVFREKRIP